MIAGLILLATLGTFGAEIFANWQEPQWEDARFQQHVRDHVPHLWQAFLAGSYWEGLYRPLSTNLIYFIGGHYFGDDPRFFHLLVVGFYVFNAQAAFYLVRRLAGFRAAVITIAFFVTRLAHTEIVLHACQLQTLWPMTFGLLALHSYLSAFERKSRLLYLGSGVWVFAALLSKETAAVLPVCCLLVTLGVRRTSAPRIERESVFMAIPFAAVVLWFTIALPFLQVRENRWWDYAFSPIYLLKSLASYATSFSNELVEPVVLVQRSVVLGRYGWFHALQEGVWAATGMGALVAVALFVCLKCFAEHWLDRGSERRTASRVTRFLSSRRVVLVCIGVLLFAVSLGPVLPLRGRFLMYYTYAGHLWLAMAVGVIFDAAFERLGIVTSQVRARRLIA